MVKRTHRKICDIYLGILLILLKIMLLSIYLNTQIYLYATIIIYWNIFGLSLRAFYFGDLKCNNEWCYSDKEKEVKDCKYAYIFYTLLAIGVSAWLCILCDLFNKEPIYILISIPIFILIGLASGSQKILSLLK